MKKILLLLLIIFLSQACCKNYTGTQPGNNRTLGGTSVTAHLVISKYLINQAGLISVEDWENTYAYLIDYSITDADNFHVLIERIINDANHTNKAAWLKLNGRYIDFDKSYETIEYSHNLRAANFSAPSRYYSIKLGNLKDSINAKGGSYKFDKYNQYVVPSITGNKLSFTLINDFDPDTYCFSIPLFRSIENLNNLSESDTLKFGLGMINESDVLIIKLAKNRQILYYDISKFPKLHNNLFDF